MSSLNGILPVDKPAGPTSHDIVARARRALGLRRIGHTGTLDPFASGLLLLCLGPSTRLAEYITALPKRYYATLRIGFATTTDDSEGAPLGNTDQWREVDEQTLRAHLERQQGDVMQVPPAFSAKKIDGERMYDVARRGDTVLLDPVRVHISRISLTRFDPPEADFEVECSSGTYIRAIARDVGESLGVGAHLTQLRRTHIGSFSVDDAVAIDRLDVREEALRAMIDPAAAVAHLPRIEVEHEELTSIRNGRSLTRDEQLPAGPLAMLSATGELIAIGEAGDGRVQPRKVFL